MRRALLIAMTLAVCALGPAGAGVSLADAERAPAARTSTVGDGTLLAARGGGRSFGGSRSRSRSGRPISPRRPASRRNIGRSILRALGLAWLFSVLFGWGPGGGGPFGLLLLLALVLLFVAAFRRRRHPAW